MHSQRKLEHIRVNLEENVQFPNLTTGLERYAFVHQALPELDLAQVTLPAVAGGSLTLRRCASCAPELLRLDAQAMFQVLPGTGSVSLDTLRREAARLSHRPRTSLFVYFDPRSAIVRRIVLDATQ